MLNVNNITYSFTMTYSLKYDTKISLSLSTFFPSKILSLDLHCRFGRRKILCLYSIFGGIACILAGVFSGYTGEWFLKKRKEAGKARDK